MTHALPALSRIVLSSLRMSCSSVSSALHPGWQCSVPSLNCPMNPSHLPYLNHHIMGGEEKCVVSLNNGLKLPKYYLVAIQHYAYFLEMASKCCINFVPGLHFPTDTNSKITKKAKFCPQVSKNTYSVILHTLPAKDLSSPYHSICK